MPSPRRFSLVATVASVAVLFSSASVLAGVILPSEPGLTYRIAFVTSGSRDATSTDISVYNQFVTDYSPTGDSRLVGITWTAIASTQSMNAKINTFTSTSASDASYPIYDTHAGLIWTGNVDLWDGTQTAPFTYDESGVSFTTVQVWTGTGNDGSTVYPLGVPRPNYGQTNPQGYWLSAGVPVNIFSRSAPLHLYGLSSPITNPTPEPSTLALLGVGGLGLMGYGWRRRASRRAAKPTAFDRPQDGAPAVLTFPSYVSQANATRRAA